MFPHPALLDPPKPSPPLRRVGPRRPTAAPAPVAEPPSQPAGLIRGRLLLWLGALLAALAIAALWLLLGR